MKSLSGFLAKIDGLTQMRNHKAKEAFSERQLIEIIDGQTRRPFDFEARLKHSYGIIAEIKRSSPSRGAIAPGADPCQVAGEYIANGASAISVLTEPSHFGGSIQDLENVRAAHPKAALLMKDFVIDPYQLLQARAHGADAVLLIVAMLDSVILKSLYRHARDLGLSVLVETHDRAEFEAAVELGATMLGINNRNLKTLATDLETSRHLISLRPPGVSVIAESGIESKLVIDEFRNLGFDGFLIGTALMQDGTPGASLRALVGS